MCPVHPGRVVLALLSGCSGGQKPSDEDVKETAKKFAPRRGGMEYLQLLKAAGETAEEILELGRKEADKWGPRAQIFIDTVIEELRK